MHGNVWEWCQDCYCDDYSSVPANGTAWEWLTHLQFRVMRGGSWDDFAKSCRSANRGRYSPVYRGRLFGIRVVAVKAEIQEQFSNSQDSMDLILETKESPLGHARLLSPLPTPKESDLSSNLFKLPDATQTLSTINLSEENLSTPIPKPVASNLVQGLPSKLPESLVESTLPDIASHVPISLMPSLNLLETGHPLSFVNSLGIEFVLIPSGDFLMGSPPDEPGRGSDEGPLHKVNIRFPFYLGKYQITQIQWEQVMGNNPSHFKGRMFPVESVSWNDCQEFIKRLNSLKDGYVYRLPSEAEWEYACRAGTTGMYSWVLDSIAWYEKNSMNSSHLVGVKEPNLWGLYDMHGNVWEWCQDQYHPNYSGAPNNGEAWGAGVDDQLRLLRGGSWNYGDKYCRSADRVKLSQNKRNPFNGFRLVATHSNIQKTTSTAKGSSISPLQIGVDRSVQKINSSSPPKSVKTVHPIEALKQPELDKSILPQYFENSIGMQFVLIPEGSFLMGSSNGFAREMPVHQVKICQPFYLGKFPVTQKQWQTVMGMNPSYFKDEMLPVESISWLDCQRFLKKLNTKKGKLVYRLPSEAEWEYACRAGATDQDEDVEAIGWYDKNSRRRLHRVGEKPPNVFGLYDMRGNVCEWCQDLYHPNYVGAPTDGSAWESRSNKQFRVLRGGSYLQDAKFCRSTSRFGLAQETYGWNFGFRIVVVPR